MRNKRWLTLAFLAGAVLAPCLLAALLFGTTLLSAMSAAVSSMLFSQPIVIVTVPFVDITTPFGRIVSITSPLLWSVVAFTGGVSCCLAMAIVKAILGRTRRARAREHSGNSA